MRNDARWNLLIDDSVPGTRGLYAIGGSVYPADDDPRIAGHGPSDAH